MNWQRAWLLIPAALVATLLSPMNAISSDKKGKIINDLDEYYNCIGKDKSETNKDACKTIYNNKREALLNKAYKIVMNEFNPVEQEKLRILQRKWITDREKICENKTSGDGSLAFDENFKITKTVPEHDPRPELKTRPAGSHAEVLYNDCMAELALHRISWLSFYPL